MEEGQGNWTVKSGNAIGRKFWGKGIKVLSDGKKQGKERNATNLQKKARAFSGKEGLAIALRLCIMTGVYDRNWEGKKPKGESFFSIEVETKKG